MTTKKKPAAKKPAAKKRERRTKNNMVYFACKAGTYVVQSRDKILTHVAGKPAYQEIPEIKLHFGDKGVSQPLHPEHDAKIIEAFRNEIQTARDEDYWGDYARVRVNNLREIHPDSPAPPVPNWETISLEKLPSVVDGLGLDLEKCVIYEEYNANREDVLNLLEDLIEKQNEPESAKPAASEKPSL